MKKNKLHVTVKPDGSTVVNIKKVLEHQLKSGYLKKLQKIKLPIECDW